MPYMTVGDDGRMVVDPFTQAADEIFEGLGKKKRKGFLKKFFRAPMKIHKKLSPVSMMMKKKKRQRGGVPQGADTSAAPDYGPIPEGPPEPSYPMPTEEQPEGAPMREAQYPPPAPIEERQSAPEAAARVPQEEYDSPPPVEQRNSGGYTIEPGEEPWNRAAPQQQEYSTDEENSESSVEGSACGAYILTGPSPKVRDYQHKRSWAKALKPRPYRGLGQGGAKDDFWYRPEIEFERYAPPSISPAAEESFHRGSSVWGDALANAHRAADPFAGTTVNRMKSRHGRGRTRRMGLPF